MFRLDIYDAQLLPPARGTLQKLLKGGYQVRGQHRLTVLDLSNASLTAEELRELVWGGIVELVSNDGNNVRAMTPIASQVLQFESGDVEVTLSADLFASSICANGEYDAVPSRRFGRH